VEEFLNQYGYIALLVGTFFEGETAILIASSLINDGLFELPYTIFFAFAGSFVSDWLYYVVGRINGKYFIAKRPALRAKLEPVQNFFDHHKIQILFSYRFLYGFRVIIPIIIGMSNIKPVQFLPFSIISGLIWSSLVNLIGYFTGKFLELETSVFEKNIFFIVLGFATFGLILGYLIRKFAFKQMVEEQGN
jgi:membrane protein DedA with SNARE-associated domain